MANLVVKIERTDDKVHFVGVSDSNPSTAIPFDFAPPLGSGDGFAGLELLLMSFAGCVSTTLVFLLGRLGKHISAYTATVEGIRSDRPLALKEIRFHVCIDSEDVTSVDMETVTKQAEAVSPVWLALKNNVSVSVTFDVRKTQ